MREGGRERRAVEVGKTARQISFLMRSVLLHSRLWQIYMAMTLVVPGGIALRGSVEY